MVQPKANQASVVNPMVLNLHDGRFPKRLCKHDGRFQGPKNSMNKGEPVRQ